MTTSSSSSSVHEDNTLTPSSAALAPKRPRLHSRKSSGTIIVPREHPKVELNEDDEEFDEDDARAMSPRRSSQDLEKMSEDARAQLNEYVLSTVPCIHLQTIPPQGRKKEIETNTELNRHAKTLQKSLLEIFNRIEAVKEEHDKLDNNNKFLQKYIGDLMSTSKITSTGAAGGRKK
ncbi:hypothetical protein EG329_001624 [Mollisiaceae sp. DMI_Dod_QoI]|nr:hypothetical protein EG329_001624 [Helotiales sp. DMI_Dod_QoI]